MRLQRKPLLVCVLLSVQCRTATSSGETSRVTTWCGMSFTGDAPLFCDNWNYLTSSTFVPSPCEFVRHAIATRSCDVRFIFFPGENPDFDPDMASHGHNNEILLELAKQPDNSRCADCGAPGKRGVCGPTCWFSRWRDRDLELSWVKNRSTSATNYTVNLKGGAAGQAQIVILISFQKSPNEL